MPKTSMTPENKVASYTEYPKLSLEHGERALIVCIEPDPTVEFRHVLTAPEIGPDGRVLKEERKNQKGEIYEATVTEWMGQHLCFGDYDTVLEKGVDPDNCPTCRAAEEEEGILPPKQHYAMHVIKYSLQPNSWNLRDPFNVDLVAWTFPPNRFNILVDLATEWGNLQEHDLKLGPCENKKFQKYDINVAKNAAWQADKARADVVKQTYLNNQAEDLSTLIARRISKADATNDVQKVLDRVAQVNNRGAKSQPAAEVSTASQHTDKQQNSDNPIDVFKSDDSDSDTASVESFNFEDLMKDL